MKLLWLQAEVGAGGADVSGGADFAPTHAEQEVYELFAAQLEAIRQDFDALYAKTIPAFNETLAARGLGRIMTVEEPEAREPQPGWEEDERGDDWGG